MHTVASLSLVTGQYCSSTTYVVRKSLLKVAFAQWFAFDCSTVVDVEGATPPLKSVDWW